MDDLKMTPARLQLLRAIGAGNVWEEWYNDEPGDVRRGEPVSNVRVTGQVQAMKVAGLCHTDPADANFHVRGIALTDAGAQLLAAHDKETQR